MPWKTRWVDGIEATSANGFPSSVVTSPPMPTTFSGKGHSTSTCFTGSESNALEACTYVGGSGDVVQ